MTLTTPLKLHLRVLEIHRSVLRVVTLRPQTPARFSTNYFHDTWHILGGADGAVMLGRLLWGLAFQRHPGTLLLIDETHLVPTPFDADPADPIIITPCGVTRLDDDLLRALRLRLRRAPGSPTTVRWHTFGMPAALGREREWWRWRAAARDPSASREQMARRAGFLCYTAPPDVLRDHAVAIYQMHEFGGRWGGYHPMAEASRSKNWHHNGEFQMIPGFADRVSAARVARRGVADPRVIAGDGERREIEDRQDVAEDRLRAARRRGVAR